MTSASWCFLHVFYITGNQYQTESKCQEALRWFLWTKRKKLLPGCTCGRGESWYVSVVSIIFDCSMPILFNFHILLATFYIILGTNILIQCPGPVPICCMFYVSQKPNIKLDKNGRRIILEYLWFLGSKINTRRCPRGPRGRGARPGPSWAPRKADGALLLLQEI